MKLDFSYNESCDRPIAVHFQDNIVSVELADGRLIGNPLHWHPWLAQATAEQRQRYALRAFSVDWDELDNGLDIQGMLLGVRPPYLSPI